jgi:hypothetical protein
MTYADIESTHPTGIISLNECKVNYARDTRGCPASVETGTNHLVTLLAWKDRGKDK